MIQKTLSTFKKNLCNYKTSRSFTLFILILFSFVHHTSLAQDETPDELLKKIRGHKKQDTILFNLYMDLSKATRGETYKQSKLYVEKARQLATKLNHTKGLGKAHYLLGTIYSQISEIDSARLYFIKSLNAFKSIKFRKGYSTCHNAIGATHYMKGDFDKALISFKKCLETDEKYNQSDNTECLNNIGSIYGQKAEYDKAIYYFKKVLRLQLKSGDKHINSAYNNLGVVYDSKGNWIKSLEYYQKANKIEKKEGYEEEMIVSYMNMGRIYFNQENFKKALSQYSKSKEIAIKYSNKGKLIQSLAYEGIIYYEHGDYTKSIRTQEEVIRIGKEIGAKQTVSFALNNLGDVLLNSNSIDRALACYLEAKDIKKEIGDAIGLLKSYAGIAEVYIVRKQWDNALISALKGKELADKNGNLASQFHLYKLLGEIYEEKGNFKQAHHHFMKYSIFKDSLYNQKNVRKLAQLEYEHMYSDSLESSTQRELTLSNRVKQADLESVKSEQFILWLIIGFMSIVLIAVLIIAFLLVRNTRTKYKNIAIEQKLLRTQMTPHFLFNSMGIIQGMILNGAYQKSLDYLSHFSKLLRLTLENSRNKTVSLEKELEAIGSYVSLQNITSKQPYNCQIHLDSNTDPKKILLPPMLIQPFVENAIEHGFNEYMDDKHIDITIQFNEGDLVCVITDNGVGIDQTVSRKTTTKTSMSTQITKDRLKLLAAEFKVSTGFSIKDRTVFSEKGTVVNLILPHKRIAND
ncbi:MAG: tetratricopeptide repeat protein [Crocinitomicaceae bacterium]|nr:tetratricopeptide repeat protein [Flavobacteriales bacterium]NQZ37778.1 tetratricopeptide repeat protein [Crocinitomicaceae bacterium]